MDLEEMRSLSGVVYRMKRIGPRTEPCGTPHDNGNDEEE